MEPANRPRKLENLAHVATIIVSLLLSVVLIKVFLLPQSIPAPSRAQPRVGMNIKQSQHSVSPDLHAWDLHQVLHVRRRLPVGEYQTNPVRGCVMRPTLYIRRASVRVWPLLPSPDDDMQSL